MLRRAAFAFAIATLLHAADFDWNLPKGFRRPAVPADNPMTTAKVELGCHLFYDKRLSINGKQSCATCHRQELAFTDGRAQAQGTTGELHSRSSMSLVNIAYAPALTWANPSLTALEDQALVPMLGDKPIELGMKNREAELIATLRADTTYQSLFAKASAPFTLSSVTRALAAFERSIVSMRSPYDRYRWAGDMSAISESAKRGEIVFSSAERGGCFRCHGGWNFSGAIHFEGGAAPAAGSGFFDTGVSEDKGKFRNPSLRNVAVTAPYMHDGSLATLEQVIEHYAAGGRVSKPLQLPEADRRDLIEFLKSLTDNELLSDPRWSDPWPQ